MLNHKHVKELQEFIAMKTFAEQDNGWSFVKTDKAPETYSELIEQSRNGFIPIADYGNDTSIYGERVNTCFRFTHDILHIVLGCDFTVKGETEVIAQQLKDASYHGVSAGAYMLFYYDTMGQVYYYEKHKKFVTNQVAFVEACVEHGMAYALENEY